MTSLTDGHWPVLQYSCRIIDSIYCIYAFTVWVPYVRSTPFQSCLMSTVPWSRWSAGRSWACTTASTMPHISTTWMLLRRNWHKLRPKVLIQDRIFLIFPFFLKHNLPIILINTLAAADTNVVLSLLSIIKFNGGGHVNHSILWTNLSPCKSEPSDNLTAAIIK